MGRLLDATEKFLVEDDWKFERDAKDPVIRTGVQAKNAAFRMLFVEHEQIEVFVLYLIAPTNVPADKRPAVAELLHRANYGLRLGNFEMDLNDGEVRYKVSVDVEGGTLAQLQIKNMVGAGITTLDRYYPAVMAVCFANQSPVDAIKQVEQ